MRPVASSLRLVTLAVAVCLQAAPAAALTIFYESFDAEPGSGQGASGGSGIGYTGFASWTVSGGSVDLVAQGDFAPDPSQIMCFGASGKCVDLDGNTNNGGVLTSISIPLSPGTYEFSYQLAGTASSFTQSGSNAANTVEASLTGGLFFESVVRSKGDPFEAFGGLFVVPSATAVQIVFEDLGGDNFGAMLDEVRIESVPEPGTVSLLLCGLLGFAFARRRPVR